MTINFGRLEQFVNGYVSYQFSEVQAIARELLDYRLQRDLDEAEERLVLGATKEEIVAMRARIKTLEDFLEDASAFSNKQSARIIKLEKVLENLRNFIDSQLHGEIQP
jgi:hypothetical protein